MSEPTAAGRGYRHSAECFAIGGGPGHGTCICRCHGTASMRLIVLDDPDWHAAMCAFDAGLNECDCLLPARIAAIEAEAAAAARTALLDDLETFLCHKTVPPGIDPVTGYETGGWKCIGDPCKCGLNEISRRRP